jgi:serine/threonine-protein kinase
MAVRGAPGTDASAETLADDATTLPRPGPAEPRAARDRPALSTRHLGGDGTLPRGAAIDRYLVLSLLGRGGMGAVYSAFDPELDRRVALKLLTTARRDAGARGRLLREARALGKLSHPNVVQVYDAGEHAGDVFIAMELVEGSALDEVGRAEPRPDVGAIVAAYVDAARGLAAAHEKGLIHRDVKPSNLLLGRDGRVRVADFGIAKGRDDAPEVEGAARPTGPVGPADTLPVASVRASDALTLPGSVVGTPLYFAPEQHEGHPASPASDQWSLCAALYESLHGEPPFLALEDAPLLAMLADLHRKKLAGPPPAPPTGSRVPAWLHRAVVRGLAPRPEDRYPGLDALIAALTHDPEAARRARRRTIAASLLGASLVALGAAGWLSRGAAVDGCAHPERELAGVWDGAVAERVRAAFAATGRAGAEDTARRVATVLDEQAGAWTRMRREVCEASRPTPHPPLVELRQACLERRRAQIGALTALFADRPDGDVVERSVSAASGLPLIALCADADALTARVPPPEAPAERARVATLWPQIDRIEALHTAGKYREGAALAEPLLPEIASLTYAPLRAQAELAVGRLRDGLGDLEGAKTFLRAAATSASEGRDDVLAATAWARLLFVTGERQRKLDEAATIRALGPTALARVHDARAEAAWLNAEGLLLYRSGKLAEAIDVHRRALALRERLLGPDHLEVAISANNLGLAVMDSGGIGDAIAILRRAGAIREKNLGPDHPDVALSLHHLGLALTLAHRDAEAKETLGRALAAYERIHGKDSPELVMPLTTLGASALETGDLATATALLERATSLAPADHPRASAARGHLALARLRQGQIDAGCALAEEALAARERLHGPDHIDVVSALRVAAECATARRQPDRAVDLLERGLRIAPRIEGVELPLAALLWDTGRDRARARVLAEQARAEFERTGNDPKRADAERWLAAHPLP